MAIYEKVLHSMREKMRSGAWPRGTMSPREVDLCEEYGVSRSTIRLAMSHLVSEGLVHRVKGLGSFVNTSFSLSSTTLFINSFVECLKTTGLSTCTRFISMDVVPAVPEINEALCLAKNASLLRVTRMRYQEGHFNQGPLVLTTAHFQAKFHHFFKHYDLGTVPIERILHENGFDRKVYEKLLTTQRMDDAQCELAGVPPDSLAICITCVGADQNHHPLEHARNLYPIDKNRFELRVQV